MICLLHVCCGPCALMCVEALREEGIEVIGYFANPNIHPVTEYLRRREAMFDVAQRLDLPMIWQDDAYSLVDWLAGVHTRGIAENEGYARCSYCYETRLKLTSSVAAVHHCDVFSTSLLYSRHQQHELIRSIGESHSGSAHFLYRDFRSLWQAGIDRSKAWGIYRQNYCACIFSESERFEKKLMKLTKADGIFGAAAPSPAGAAAPNPAAGGGAAAPDPA